MASFTWVIVAVLYMLMDVAYFIRGALLGIVCKLLGSVGIGKIGPLDEVRTHGKNGHYVMICLPSLVL